MQLRTYKRQHPDQLVKIGTEDGAGYIYTGVMGDCDLTPLNTQLEKGVWKAFADRCALFKRYRDANFPHTTSSIKCLLKLHDAVKDFTPLWSRDIVSVDPSISEEGVTIVIIKGSESGRHWMVDETPRMLTRVSDRGIIALAGAIYRDMYQNLTAEYLLVLKGETKGAQAKRIEQDILEDTHGGLKDPSYLIRFARKMAVEQFCYRNGKLIMTTEKAMKLLKKRMGA